MNAIAERWVQSVQRECLDRMILFGEVRLRHVLDSYLAHYHSERAHQGIGNELINGEPPRNRGEVVVHQRLGGLLNHYHRLVA